MSRFCIEPEESFHYYLPSIFNLPGLGKSSPDNIVMLYRIGFSALGNAAFQKTFSLKVYVSRISETVWETLR